MPDRIGEGESFLARPVCMAEGAGFNFMQVTAVCLHECQKPLKYINGF